MTIICSGSGDDDYGVDDDDNNDDDDAEFGLKKVKGIVWIYLLVLLLIVPCSEVLSLTMMLPCS